jgi:hypothetical protein
MSGHVSFKTASQGGYREPNAGNEQDIAQRKANDGIENFFVTETSHVSTGVQNCPLIGVQF